MSAEYLPQPIDRDAPILAIGVAARLAGMHPQTLRGYDKLGLVVPRRASGRGRRYSMSDIDRLRLVQHLSQNEGVNLPGIRAILELQERLGRQEAELVALREHLDAAVAANRGPRRFTASERGDVFYDPFGRARPLPALPAG